MKVLHVSYSDGAGGAAIGARRIHEALLKSGCHSSMLCADIRTSSPGVIRAFGPRKFFVIRFLNRVIGATWRFFKKLLCAENIYFSSLGIIPTGLHKTINRSDVDIVNLHWVNNEMISIGEIAKIKKPVVWTLHDMWPICGGAHILLDKHYERFEAGYEEGLVSNGHFPDLDRWVWKRKSRLWKDFKPFFVGVSSWMAGNAEKSRLFPDARVVVIPNTVDVLTFRPTDSRAARQSFALPLDKKIILFACTPAPCKGMDLMVESLRCCVEMLGSDAFLAVAFGNSNGVIDQFADLPVRFVGRIYEESRLAELYAAADVTCVPSQIESFGQTAAESLACGTPVVAYRCSGLVDIVDHEKNGYLAHPFDVRDFSIGIQWVIDVLAEDMSTSKQGCSASCEAGRLKAEAEWAESVVASKYLSVYNGLLESRKTNTVKS